MKLYLVRHGQTDWNVAMKPQGRSDIPLNEVGIRQARALVDKINELELDGVYSSPLCRAYETAKIITDGKHKIVVDELLTERGFGALEGTRAPVDWKKYWQLNYVGDVEGMESLAEVFERTRLFLEKLKQNHSADAKILIVGHGGSLKALYYNAVGYDENTDFFGLHFNNSEIKECNYDDKKDSKTDL